MSWRPGSSAVAASASAERRQRSMLLALRLEGRSAGAVENQYPGVDDGFFFAVGDFVIALPLGLTT